MSLTSLLSDPSHQALRDQFKLVFPKPDIQLKGQLLAPPITTNYSVVGQAFDYLLRFKLERQHGSLLSAPKHWIADGCYHQLMISIRKSESEYLMVGQHRNIPKNRIAFQDMIVGEYQKAKENHLRFLKNGRVNDELVKSCLFLARLDVLQRAKMIDQNLGNESAEDVEDVKRIYSLVRSSKFAAKEHCIVNPNFNKGSLLVGGADADLILDDTLIDIKVIKELKVTRNQFNQLIGYYILSLVGGVNQSPKFKPINSIGIYFARHAVLWKVPISEIASKKDVQSFKRWFIDYVNKIHQ